MSLISLCPCFFVLARLTYIKITTTGCDLGRSRRLLDNLFTSQPVCVSQRLELQISLQISKESLTEFEPWSVSTTETLLQPRTSNPRRRSPVRHRSQWF